MLSTALHIPYSEGLVTHQVPHGTVNDGSVMSQTLWTPSKWGRSQQGGMVQGEILLSLLLLWPSLCCRAASPSWWLCPKMLSEEELRQHRGSAWALPDQCSCSAVPTLSGAGCYCISALAQSLC